jgi:adenosylhomocysteine nucleosidase
MSKEILVAAPLQEEYSALRESLTSRALRAEPDQIGKLEVHRFPELGITLARGGHGKTQFGVQTQYLLDQAQFDLVICAGAAGALGPEVGIGDLIVATSTLEHDFNLKFVSRPNPQFAGDAESIARIRALKLDGVGFKIHFGTMASGDEDVVDVARGAGLHASTGALGVAWEGAGGARAAKFSGVPYLELRGATDTADHEAPVVFDENLKIVMKNIASLLVCWLREIR